MLWSDHSLPHPAQVAELVQELISTLNPRVKHCTLVLATWREVTGLSVD